jgi:large subunit ribosomal protein L18
MSRVGRQPVPIPAGVTVSAKDRLVTIKGPKGELKYTHRPEIEVAIAGNQINVSNTRSQYDKAARAYHGLTRALLQNMVDGVTKGYERKLEITGVGYTIKLEVPNPTRARGSSTRTKSSGARPARPSGRHDLNERSPPASEQTVMSDIALQRAKNRQRKAWRVRKRVRGDAGRPRLSVFRSNTNIYCQVIDDLAGRTLAAASSLDKDLRDQLGGLKKAEVAAKVGDLIAARAKQAGVNRVRFDRGPYIYHGRVKALADSARKGGLEF